MKRLDKEILAIALPSIVSNVTVPLLGLIDVSIVGHMGNAAYIGAISVGSMIFNVIYWIFGFLRMGTSGMTSQAYGRGDMDECAGTLARSLAVGVGIGLLFVVLQPLVETLAMAAMGATEDVDGYARTYFKICIWGAPAVLGLYSMTGWYIGMQNTKVPMMVSIVQNVVNIVASLSFVYLLGMKVEGVAAGTLVAQYAGFAMAGFMMKWRYGDVVSRHLSLSAMRDGAAMLRFFTVNRDIFVRTLFLVAVNLFFTSAGASQGALTLSVNTMLFQLFTLYSFVMDGFAFAGEAIGGKYYGARDRAMFMRTVKRLLWWSLALTAVYAAAYCFGAGPFFRILTDEADVLDAMREYLPWAVAIPVAGMGAFYWDGLYIGMTATRGMLAGTFAGALAFFSVYVALRGAMGNHALWLALMMCLVMRGVVQTLLFKRLMRW